MSVRRTLTAGAVQQASPRVTVWRHTGLDDETHIAFSRIFGHIELAPRIAKSRHAHRELFDASNLDVDGRIVQDEMIRLHKRGDRLWHTDSSFMELRSAQSLLLCHESPLAGGETWFADTRSAYEDLPQAMKDRIEGLEARHPLVHVHKGSGRKALYVTAHARDIVGMPRDEGRALLRELIEFATQPQYVFNVAYQPGDMVIWDNLCSMHRGGGYDEVHHRRDMRRATIREAPAPAEADDPFTELFRASGRPVSDRRPVS